MSSKEPSWETWMGLQVPRKVGKIVQSRWGLGLGFASADGVRVRPPVEDRGSQDAATEIAAQLMKRHRHGELTTGAVIYATPTGSHQAAVPLVLGRTFLGCLLAGDFDPARINGMELGFLTSLLELAAEEILAFQADQVKEQLDLLGGREVWATRYSYDAIIGQAQIMQELYQLLDKVIDSDSTVLIQGENGTGKELVAKAIHYNSARKDRRFVIQNCSAFNDNLLDSELFGHKRGAFTGAIADKQGLFEVADGGTFFLDEIGDMSPALQVKVLRVLQEGTFIPVGDTTSKKVDVRIIAATNRNLRKMVDQGEFREDLYYRINVINLTLPSLRERRDDIPLLTDHFLKKHTKGKKQGRRLSKECLDRMLDYHWPGNVRELENEIERVLVLSGDEKLMGPELLSPRIQKRETDASGFTVGQPQGLPEAVSALERRMIYEVLRRHHWNKTRAATELRISRRNLIRLVQKYNLEPHKNGAPVRASA